MKYNIEAPVCMVWIPCKPLPIASNSHIVLEWIKQFSRLIRWDALKEETEDPEVLIDQRCLSIYRMFRQFIGMDSNKLRK